MQLSEYQALVLREFLGQSWGKFTSFLEREHGVDADEAENVADDIYEVLEQV